MKLGKTEIQLKTFLKKGLKGNDSKYRVHCVCGRPGSGKTYSVIKHLYEQYPDKKIYTNVKNNLPNQNRIVYLTKLSDFWCLTDPGIIVIDEIFRVYTKHSKIDSEFLGWLSLVRHHQQIIFFVCQEWREINMSIRHATSRMMKVRKLPVLPIFIESWGDADNLQYDDVENEYIAPIYYRKIYKRNQKIGALYNTHELVKLSK
jgi:hypothetical protein